MRAFFAFLAKVWPLLLIALFAGLVFLLPNQVLDIYRDIAQRTVLGSAPGIANEAGVWSELTQSAVTLSAFVMLLWLAALARVGHGAGDETGGQRWTSAFAVGAPIVIALTPLLLLAAGLLAARVSPKTEQDVALLVADAFKTSNLEVGVDSETADLLSRQFASRLIGYNARLRQIAAGAILLSLALGGLFAALTPQAAISRLLTYRRKLGLGSSLWYLAIVATGYIAVSLMVASQPARLSPLFNPIALFCLFCSFAIVALDAIRRLSELTRLPLLGCVIAIAIAYSFTGLNDNHAIRYEKTASVTPIGKVPEAADEFRKWFASRADRGAYSAGRGYPIYIVAAQGGGIYAAYHTATFLASLQTICPNFAHHLFAVSGVSGGSVGAAIFNALARDAEVNGTIKIPGTGCNDGTLNEGPSYSLALGAIFSTDFWTPLQAALLFPDFLQRFLLWPVPSFDRSLALERGLEAAWLDMKSKGILPQAPSKAASGNQIADAYEKHWNVAELKHAPALVFNTTEVSTGHRRLIAPFQFHGVGTLELVPVSRMVGDRPVTLSLSTAAVLSARFPWITPLGWYLRSDGPQAGQQIGLVDGGYFENSGVATALDLIKELNGAVRAGGIDQNVEFNLIILTSKDFASEEWTGLGEVLSPVRAMLNTRAARGQIEIDRAKTEVLAMASERTKMAALEVELRGLGYPLPLGWRMSTATRYLIEAQLGSMAKCPASMPSNGDDVNCIKKRIFERLKH